MKAFDPIENSPSPAVHSARIRHQLGELIDHLKADRDRVDDPVFAALLEVSAEMLHGVRNVFAEYDEASSRKRQLVEITQRRPPLRLPRPPARA